MGKLPIRPIIVVQASPREVAKNDMLRISVRFYDEKLQLMEVSRIYMTITSMKDGHTVWPLEVVRKNTSGFDIGIGTEEMKEGHDYLVRISNNWNLSPSASTTFMLKETPFPVAVLALPLILSPLFMRKYVDRGITDVDGLVEHLKGLGMSDDKIQQELNLILKEVEGIPEEQMRLPVDTSRDILKKIFVTQMDARVCPRCLERSQSNSRGLSSGEYFPEDPSVPVIPVHPRCRCTFDLVYVNPTREASFQSAARAANLAELEMPLQAISFIKSSNLS